VDEGERKGVLCVSCVRTEAEQLEAVWSCNADRTLAVCMSPDEAAKRRLPTPPRKRRTRPSAGNARRLFASMRSPRTEAGRGAVSHIVTPTDRLTLNTSGGLAKTVLNVNSTLLAEKRKSSRKSPRQHTSSAALSTTATQCTAEAEDSPAPSDAVESIQQPKSTNSASDLVDDSLLSGASSKKSEGERMHGTRKRGTAESGKRSKANRSKKGRRSAGRSSRSKGGVPASRTSSSSSTSRSNLASSSSRSGSHQASHSSDASVTSHSPTDRTHSKSACASDRPTANEEEEEEEERSEAKSESDEEAENKTKGKPRAEEADTKESSKGCCAIM
jgi:hypothetical protein